MKYTKSALGLLNAQYRSVLKKCLLINLGLFALSAPAMATDVNTAEGLTSALQAGDNTINVTDNIAGIGSATISGKTNTLDLNGNTLSGATAGNSGYNFANGSTLTLTGGGTISGFNNPDANPASVDGGEYGALNIGENSTLTISDENSNWTFSGNKGGLGAVNSLNGSVQATVNKMIFENNTSDTQGGGFRHDVTVYEDNTVARITANEIVFSGNTIGSSAVVGSGAGAMNSRGTMELLGTTNTFTNNQMNATVAEGRKYKVGGGAVANQSGESSGHTYNATMVIGTANSVNTFSGNTSSTNGGAVMNRAVDEDGNATLTINGNSTFSGNSATGLGGAIFNNQWEGRVATVNINGTALFENNTANGEANDIYNTGTLNLVATTSNDSIVLNGGIDGDASTKGTTNISGAGYVKVANALKNQNVTNSGELRLDGADLTGTTITGSGDMKIIGDSEIEGNNTFNQDVTVEEGQELDITSATIDGTGKLINSSGATLNINSSTLSGGDLTNASGGTLKITDSNIDVDVNNAGTLISDPTTYSGTVTNTGLASFDADTFTNTAVLANTGITNLSNGVTFQTGATITGAGTTNLVSGTTHFNNTVNANTINLLSGANFDGTLNGGKLNTQNGTIDTISGAIQNATLALDVNTTTATADTFTGGITSSTIESLNITGAYGTADDVTIALGTGVSLASGASINGGYYTKAEIDGSGNLKLSDKLINTSTIRGTGDGTSTFTGDVVIGDKAATTTVGTAKAKISLSDSGEKATVTAANGLVISDGATTPNTATLKADANGLNSDKTILVGTNGTKLTNSSLVISNGTATQDATLTTTANGLNVDKGITVGTGAYGLSSAGKATIASLSLGGTDVTSTATELNLLHGMTAVDTTGTAVASGATTTLATGATVYAGAGKASYNNGTAGTNIAANSTINSAIGTLDTAIGNRDYTDGKYLTDSQTVTASLDALNTGLGAKIAADGNYIKASTTNSINQNISALDTQLKNTQDEVDKVETALGVLNTDGTYNASALTSTMYKASGATGGTTLAASLNNLATNIGTITGVTLSSTGTAVVDYANNNVVSDNTNLATAIGALDGAIGNRDYTTGTGYYLTDSQTVTASLEALNVGLHNAAAMVGPDPTNLTATGALGQKGYSQISGTTGLGKTNLANAVETLSVAMTDNSIDAGFKTMGVADGSGHSSTLSAITDGSTGSLLNVSTGLKVNGNETVTGNATIGGNADIAGSLKVGTSDAFQVAANGTVDIKDTTSGKNTFEASSTGLKIGTDVSAAGTTTFSVNAADGALSGLGITTDATNGVDLGIAGTQTDIIGSKVNIGDTTAGKASVVVDNTASAEKTTISGGTSKIEMNSANGVAVTGNTTVTGTLGVGSDGAKFTVDANGNITKAGTVNATGIQTTATTANIGDAGTTAITIGTNGTAANTIAIGGAKTTSTTVTSDTFTVNSGSNALSVDKTNGTTVTGNFTATSGTTTLATTNVKGDLSVKDSSDATTFTVDDATGNVQTAGSVRIGATNGTDGATLAYASSTLTVTSAHTAVTGDLKVGSANAISSTTAGVLDMGKNAMTNVKGLTLTDGETTPSTVAMTVEKVTVGGGSEEAALQVAGNTLVTGQLASTAGLAVLKNGASAGTYDEVFTVDANNMTYKNSAGTTTFNVAATDGALTAANIVTTATTATIGDAATAGNASIALNNSTSGSGTATITGKTISVGDANSTTTSITGKTVNVGSTGTGTATNVTGETIAIGGTGTTTASLKSGTNGVTVTSTGTAVTGNETVSGTLTADGETKLGKYTSGTGGYALDVKSDAVTANQVIEAKEGVKFGTDTIAMTSVKQTAVSSVADDTNNQTALVSAKSLQQTRLAMTNENEAVFGGVYNYNTSSGAVTYAASALTSNMYKSSTGAGADLTESLNNLAANTDAALGGTFATNGTWSATVNNSTPNSYTYTATSNVMAAMNQIAGNVGTKAELANQFNGILQTQSVNKNIDALNSKVGNVATLNTALGNLTNGTTTPPATVVAALNNLDATLGKIHGLYDGSTVNSTTVTSTVSGHSNLAVGTTVEDHLVTLDNAIGDRTLASANTQINEAMAGTPATATTPAVPGSLAKGIQAAGNAIGDMDFSSAHYYTQSGASANLSDAVRTLDSNLYRVDNEVRKLKHDFNSGMASMAAMTALVPNSRSQGNTSLSLGTGAYNGHTAMAIGGFHYLTDNILLNAGASWGNSNDMAYRLGVTWSW